MSSSTADNRETSIIPSSPAPAGETPDMQAIATAREAFDIFVKLNGARMPTSKDLNGRLLKRVEHGLLGQNLDSAEDILQNVYIEIVEAMARDDKDSGFKPEWQYLFRLNKRPIDLHRKSERCGHIPVNEDGEEMEIAGGCGFKTTQSDDPRKRKDHADIIHFEERNRLAMELMGQYRNRLTGRELELYGGVYEGGLSTDKFAEQAGISLRNAQKIESVMLGKLKKWLDEDERFKGYREEIPVNGKAHGRKPKAKAAISADKAKKARASRRNPAGEARTCNRPAAAE